MEGENATLSMIIEAKILGEEFLTRKLITKDGAIFSTFKNNHAKLLNYGVNHEVTSESVGLTLIYALLTDNKTLFDLEFNFLRVYMVGPYGVCYWKLNEDLSPFKYGGFYSSASIDDLGIAEALILGYEKWGEQQYLNLAKNLIKSIYDWEIDKNTMVLVDYLNWREKTWIQAKTLTLSYARFSSIKKFIEYDERWREVFNKTLGKVLEGRVDENPLFFEAYDISTGRYMNYGKYVDTINQLLIGINLFDAGETNEALRLYLFFKVEYEKKGLLNNAYDPSTLRPSRELAGAGTYSLLARLAIKLGDESFAIRVIKEKILSVQCREAINVYYGVFMNEWPSKGLEANAYDNIQTLITMMELIKTLKGEGLAYNSKLDASVTIKFKRH